MTDHQRQGPPSTAEIAVLTARLRDLSDAGRSADTAARATFLADKHALLNRIRSEAAVDPWADYRTYTPAEAAAQLTRRGIPPADAAGEVGSYLDDLTAVRGEPPDGWEIDDDDLAAISERHQRPIPVDPTWSAETAARILARDGRPLDEARGQVADYLDRATADVGVPVHGWGLDARDLDAIRASTGLDDGDGDALDQARVAVAALQPDEHIRYAADEDEGATDDQAMS